MTQLPEGWAWSTVGDVTLPVAKHDPRKSPGTEIDYIDIGGIDGKRRRIESTKRYGGADAPSRARQLVCEGDTLLSTVRINLTKTALVPPSLHGATASTGFSVLRPCDAMRPEFLFHQVTHRPFVNSLAELQTGSSYPAVRDRDVRAMSVAVPPVAEQRRIVAAIEEHFSRLDAAVAGLDGSAKRLVKFGRQLLASLLEVPLAPWLDTEEPTEPLPEGWKWRRAGDVCDGVVSGSTPQASDMIQGVGEVPFIKVYNLQFDGHLDFTIKPTFVSPETHASKLKRSRVVPGDVLTNIVGPPLGKISVVPATYSEWNINQAIAAFKPSPELDGSFLSKLLLANVVMRPLLRTGKATAGQINLSISSCRRLWLPIPPLSEQRRLVAEIDSAMAVCDSLLVDTQKAATRAAALRRSILAAAFSGRLVTQDPSDEPAAVLLERIAAERAASKPSRKTKSTS